MMSEQVRQLLIGLCGGIVGLGIALLVRGLWPPRPADDAGFAGPVGVRVESAGVRVSRRATSWSDDGIEGVWLRWRWPVATAAGSVVWGLSGMPAAGLAAASATVAVPMVVLDSAAEMRAIERLVAVGVWARGLAEVLAGGAGLEQAVAATADTCPAAIQRTIGDLAVRWAAGRPADEALRAFADDLDDADVDVVVATLVLGSRNGLPELSKALDAAVDAVAERVDVRQRIEAQRVARRRKARNAVAGVMLAVLVLVSFNPTYLRPYGTATGQWVLVLLTVLFTACLYWMQSLCRTRPSLRLLVKGVAAGPWPRASRDAEGAP